LPVSKISLSESVEEYISRREKTRRFSPNTITNDRTHLGRFARVIEGKRGMQVKNLTADKVFEYFFGEGGLHDVHYDGNGTIHPPIEGASHNVLRRRIRALNAYCAKRGWTNVDWLEDVPTMEEEEKIRLRLTPREILEVFDVADNPRDRIYLVACANTACRQSELKDRQIKHLNLDKGYMTVRIYKSRKTRDVWLTAEFAAELRAWLIYYAEQIGRPLEPDDYLFPHRKAGLFSWKRDPSVPAGGYPIRTGHVIVPEMMIPKTEYLVQKSLRNWDPSLDLKGVGTHTIRRSIARAVQHHGEAQGDYGSALRATARVLNHKYTTTTEKYVGRDEADARVEAMMRDQPFLTAMVDDSNVVPLKRAEGM
jgi:site-specific recombinase XerD